MNSAGENHVVVKLKVLDSADLAQESRINHFSHGDTARAASLGSKLFSFFCALMFEYIARVGMPQ